MPHKPFSPTWPVPKSVTPLVAVLLYATLFMLAGCAEEIPVVEPIKRPDQSRTTDMDERVARKKKPKTKKKTPQPGKQANVPAKPAKPPVKVDPVILKATEMRTEIGEADAEGGWKVSDNGALQADIKTSFSITEMQMEMKADPAGNVWPEVELNLWEKNSKSTYFPWGNRTNTRDFVTTSSYFNYIKPINPPIPPGEYLVTFRFYNNGTVGTEDRNVYLRRILLLP